MSPRLLCWLLAVGGLVGMTMALNLHGWHGVLFMIGMSLYVMASELSHYWDDHLNKKS